jgi:hypothetical protein
VRPDRQMHCRVRQTDNKGERKPDAGALWARQTDAQWGQPQASCPAFSAAYYSRPAWVITEMRILVMAKQGPNVVFCMSNRDQMSCFA